MQQNIISIHEHPKEIDLNYFSSYGGNGYSNSYQSYTVPPSKVINSLVSNEILFDTLLDAGCASGELVRDFRRLGVRSYGIENNKEILKKCVIPKFCTEMDLRDISEIKNSSFDIVYCNSLMYFGPSEILSILLEFYRISNKAVYLCNPFLEEGKEETFLDQSRVFLATENWWDHQFKEAGFKKIVNSVYLKV